MSTINAFIRTTNTNKPANVRFRIRHGKETDIEFKNADYQLDLFTSNNIKIGSANAR